MISNNFARSPAASSGGESGMSIPSARRTSSGISPASSPSKNLSIRSSSAIRSISSCSIKVTPHLHAPRLPRFIRGVNFFYWEWRRSRDRVGNGNLIQSARVLAREGIAQREGVAMKLLPAVFDEREIRRVYDEKSEIWFFSVVDIVQVLTQ